MNNCLPSWPIFFTLQFIFLAACLTVWRAIYTRREQRRMPALSVFVAAAGIFNLVTTIFADT